MKAHLKTSIFRLILTVGGLLLSLGVMAQQKYTDTDTVCAGSQNQVYGVMGANPGSTYVWGLSDPMGGVIDLDVVTGAGDNDSIIEVDWGTTPGTYTLLMYETTIDGCLGDTVELDVVIDELPTVAIVADSVCSDNISHITFTFTGEAPWVIEYTDGDSIFTDTTSISPYTASLPAYSNNTGVIITKQIDVTSLMDATTCFEDTSDLPSTIVGIYPQPSAGPIYHY